MSAWKYHSSFGPEEQQLFTRKNIPIKFVNERKNLPAGYVAHLWDVQNGAGIADESVKNMLLEAGWSSPDPWVSFDARHAQKYDLEDMFTIEAKLLMEYGIDNNTAKSYHRRHFSATGVVHLIQSGVPQEEVEEYVSGCPNCYPEAPKHSQNYDADSIVTFFRTGFSASEAKRYTSLCAHHVLLFRSLGITLDTASEELQRKLLPLLTTLIEGNKLTRANPEYKEYLITTSLTFGRPYWDDDVVQLGKEYTLLGVGGNAVVLFDHNSSSAYKITEDPTEEIRLFNKLKQPKNVIQLLDVKTIPIFYERTIFPHVIQMEQVAELEYIKGKTIKAVLKENNKPFSLEQILWYGAQIFNGLMELREVDIFHRDLTSANVLVDERDNRAVIIDLGHATDKPNAEPTGNRRMGGGHDLISFGQLLYWMATGTYLFNPTIEESSWYSASGIRQFRVGCYQTPEILERRLQMLSTLKSDLLRRVIHLSLTASPRPANSSIACQEAYEELEEYFKTEIGCS